MKGEYQMIVIRCKAFIVEIEINVEFLLVSGFESPH
jgi:hypothetical protein